MNSTWLSRKIKGPNAEGDPVKKKKGGVKPYIAKDDADYAKRTQMYNDSLAAYNATQNIINTLKTPNMIVEDNAYTGHNYYTNAEGSTGDLNSEPYESYSGVKGVAQDIKTLKRTEKSLGNTESVKSKMYYDGGGLDSTFELPYRPKPKQEILPPLSKNKPTITKNIVKKKPRPKDTISKMPIGKLKSKSTTPKKLKSRENMKMLTQTVMGTSGKQEPALSYQKRKGLTDNQMYQSFPGLKPK